MKLSTKITLIYSVLGFIGSVSLTSLFEAFPSIRIFSNEAAVFGVMSAFMHLAIKRLASSSEQLVKNEEQSNANQQS